MRIPLYQIDAFAEGPFTGNPAAVCPLDAWLPAETMQAIAAENNLSETAFFVPRAMITGCAGSPRERGRSVRPRDIASAFVVFAISRRGGTRDFQTEKAGS